MSFIIIKFICYSTHNNIVNPQHQENTTNYREPFEHSLP